MGVRDKDGRRKKSWSEIDKMRDKSRHTRGGGDREKSPEDKRRESSGAYGTYKKDIDKVFSGAEIPAYLKAALPKGDGEGRLKLLGAIRRSTDEEELADAMRAYLEKYDDFPDDFELMQRVMDYPDEAVQLKVLRQLKRMAEFMPVPHKKQFILKIDGLAMLADDDDLRELAEELADMLR